MGDASTVARSALGSVVCLRHLTSCLERQFLDVVYQELTTGGIASVAELEGWCSSWLVACQSALRSTLEHNLSSPTRRRRGGAGALHKRFALLSDDATNSIWSNVNGGAPSRSILDLLRFFSDEAPDWRYPFESDRRILAGYNRNGNIVIEWGDVRINTWDMNVFLTALGVVASGRRLEPVDRMVLSFSDNERVAPSLPPVGGGPLVRRVSHVRSVLLAAYDVHHKILELLKRQGDGEQHGETRGLASVGVALSALALELALKLACCSDGAPPRTHSVDELIRSYGVPSSVQVAFDEMYSGKAAAVRGLRPVPSNDWSLRFQRCSTVRGAVQELDAASRYRYAYGQDFSDMIFNYAFLPDGTLCIAGKRLGRIERLVVVGLIDCLTLAYLTAVHPLAADDRLQEQLHRYGDS